jgi:hypothetical protein
MAEPREHAVVHVLFTDGAKVTCQATPASTVATLLTDLASMPASDFPDDCAVLLLYRGKILDPGALLFDVEPDLPEFTVHCFVRPQAAPNRDSTLNFHGFDRLFSMNYSADQISRIRENFHRFQGTELEGSGQDRLDLEDEWYPALFSSELPLDFLLSETDGIGEVRRDPRGGRRMQGWFCFVLGLVLGFYFGIGALVFTSLTFRDKKVLSWIFLGSLLHYCLDGSLLFGS